MINQYLFDEVYSYNKVPSSMSTAQKMIQNGDVKGNFLVVVNEQTGGKGRIKNKWFSPDGGLWFTMALYGLPLDSSLTLFTGVIIHKTIVDLFPELEGSVKIKWPNDIYIDNRKVCGILTSHLGHKNYFLVGIGIDSNVHEFPEELQDIATSLSIALDTDIDHDLFLEKLFELYAEELPEFIENRLKEYLEYYRYQSYLTGKEIVLSTEFDKFKGKVQGINSKGALLLELEQGMIQPFYSGSVDKIY